MTKVEDYPEDVLILLEHNMIRHLENLENVYRNASSIYSMVIREKPFSFFFFFFPISPEIIKKLIARYQKQYHHQTNTVTQKIH